MIKPLLKSKAAKPLLFVVSLLPFTWLLWALFNDQLGANPVEKLTHETGLWSLRFLLLTLTVTPLMRLTRIAAFSRFRRMLGLYTFFYALCHFAIWFVADHSLDIASMWMDIVDRPYITMGFLGLLVMVPLAVTSNRFMVSRLGRQWLRLHQLTYVVLMLAVLHFIWLVKADYLEAGVYSVLAMALMAIRIYYWVPALSSRQKSSHIVA